MDTCVVCGGYVVEGSQVCKKCMDRHGLTETLTLDEVYRLRQIREETVKWVKGKISAERFAEKVYGLLNVGKGGLKLVDRIRIGDSNSGSHNSGHRNSGWRNSGHWNSGWHNSGDCNSGHCNSGNYNSGHWNSGSHNSGDCNSGDWNVTDGNSGCFCTRTHTIKFFDEDSNWTLEDWRMSDACRLLRRAPLSLVKWIPEVDMTDEEKAEHSEHTTTGGYLKELSIEERTEAAQKWWDSLNADGKQVIKSIPNFDPVKFKQITGIEVD